MLTKQQKTQQIKESKELIKGSKMLIFVDFTGTTVDEIKKLRRALLAIGSKLKVVKKKLLRVALSEDKIDFNPEQFESQIGTIFSSADISEIAGPIYKFSKEAKNKEFKILGGYDLSAKNFIEGEIVKQIGQLPSREILLGQLVGMFAMPIKMFMNVLEQKSKQMVEK
ncbi:MAG: 50S ribosomal protein L10 [Candidatus Wolfebacteria bacterium GW2011_GWC1_37_10]|uniref:Large ribosomal subunit protein uL10 n=1 Tax=Candidatus Wolfebacteria bacterium GW2011_GWC1_37_10 TaxID=1619010 RepID=A0A0G0IFM4_9BACT|nr:MAG: 50S ribosomal protein L10 [Candidatus Wolfebacteria bacterium GW2011_GWC1_37_10]